MNPLREGAVPPTGIGLGRIGSVKSNLGHMLGAAAMPGLIKVLLAMRKRILPPSLLAGRRPRLGDDQDSD